MNVNKFHEFFDEIVTFNRLWKKFVKMKGVLHFKFHDFLLKLSFDIFFEKSRQSKMENINFWKLLKMSWQMCTFWQARC